MPKRSKEDTEQTIQSIKETVIDQLINLGYDTMSYTTLSKQTGISRTGISHHFPKKTDLSASVDDSLFNMLVEHLDVDSNIENFCKSWIESLESPQFLAIARVYFYHLSSSEAAARRLTHRGIGRLFTYLEKRFQSEKEEAINRVESLIGRTALTIARSS